MLHRLPAEIALLAVSHLPLQSLYCVALVSQAWHELIVMNESEVYRNAALLHRFVGAEELYARSMEQGPDGKAINWKSFCVRQLQIERGWRAKEQSTVKEFTATGCSVHRIKVDEKYGFIITTYKTGGLLVTNIKDNKMLWALSPSHVVDYAHCEYARGYLIINRYNNCKEIWRHSLDIRDDEQSERCPPDEQMRIAHSRGSSSFVTGRRGQFRPWSLLQTPEVTRAFRFSYPTLLASATDNAYFYDVPNSRLVETIHDIQQMKDERPLGRINYVEVNDRYAFVCGAKQLRIFAREGGALMFHLSTRQLSRRMWDIYPSYDEPRRTVDTIVKPLKIQHAFHIPPAMVGEFMAVHVFPSGKDIAALTSTGVLVLVPGFERLFSGEVTLDDIAILINFGSPSDSNTSDISKYLAMGERNGKIAVALVNGIYLVSPDLQFSRLTAEQPPHPGITICQLREFQDPRFLFFVSCLQVTHKGIYYNYKPSQSTGTQQPNGFGAVQALDAMQVAFQQQPEQQQQEQQNAAGPVADEESDEDETPPPALAEEDEFEDEFEDDEDEDEVMGNPPQDNAPPVNDEDQAVLHMIINEWFLPTHISTVYSVTF